MWLHLAEHPGRGCWGHAVNAMGELMGWNQATPPRRWVWGLLLLLFLLVNFCVNLSAFAEDAPKEIDTGPFWTWAFIPGVSAWLMTLAVRIAFYAFALERDNQRHYAPVATNTPRYISWKPPSPLKWWVWMILFFVFIGVDVLVTLLNFAQAPQNAITSGEFWGWALFPGICSWLLALSLRMGWYALWQMHSAVNDQLNEQDWQYRNSMRREQAHLIQRVLLGPACTDDKQRAQLLTALMPCASPESGVLAINDDALLNQQQADRARCIARLLAQKMARWPLAQHIEPDLWVWSGSTAAWSSFSTALRVYGYLPPIKPHRMGSIEALDWMIDRLYDEHAPQQFILYAGLEVPTAAVEIEAVEAEAEVLRSEVAFVLLLGQGDGQVKIGRAQTVSTAADLSTVKTDAALGDEVVMPFLSIPVDKPDYAANANWTSINQALTAYWHDMGSAAPWVSLLMTCDWVEQEQKQAGWIAPVSTQNWAGLVFPIAEANA